MDTNGVDAALSVLKKIERERGKNIFLISHRDELVGRVNTILQVTKENGFTTFSTDTEYVSGS
jgi:DNA repair exonuclease SbcCD ATPase subunit